MIDMLQMMFWPIVACLILTGMHVYLGYHVLERQIIFVDLALAQMAALGLCIALLVGLPMESSGAYGLAFLTTLLGALLFSLSRYKSQRVPQEALIGIIYVVSAAAAILVLSRFGEGDEKIRGLLVGEILLVSTQDILHMFWVYSLIGIFHFIFRRQFFELTSAHDIPIKNMNQFWWDFLFYVSFGIVVTSSVKIAGVLLVFSFLIIPNACAFILSKTIQTRLLVGWLIGFLTTISGMYLSYKYDFPTGAAIVCLFGAVLFVVLAGESILKMCFRR